MGMQQLRNGRCISGCCFSVESEVYHEASSSNLQCSVLWTVMMIVYRIRTERVLNFLGRHPVNNEDVSGAAYETHEACKDEEKRNASLQTILLLVYPSGVVHIQSSLSSACNSDLHT